MSDIAGTWEIRVTSLLGSIDGTLDLVVDGDTVTGTGRAANGSIKLDEGTVDGDSVTIPIELSNPIEVRATAKLTVSGDTMKGKISGAPIPGVHLSGRRVG